jgi:hypothetical protein
LACLPFVVKGASGRERERRAAREREREREIGKQRRECGACAKRRTHLPNKSSTATWRNVHTSSMYNAAYQCFPRTRVQAALLLQATQAVSDATEAAPLLGRATLMSEAPTAPTSAPSPPQVGAAVVESVVLHNAVDSTSNATEVGAPSPPQMGAAVVESVVLPSADTAVDSMSNATEVGRPTLLPPPQRRALTMSAAPFVPRGK